MVNLEKQTIFGKRKGFGSDSMIVCLSSDGLMHYIGFK